MPYAHTTLTAYGYMDKLWLQKKKKVEKLKSNLKHKTINFKG